MPKEKIRIAIVGYGNVGRGVYRAIARNPDMEFAGIISRDPARVGAEFSQAGQIATTIMSNKSEDNFYRLHADVAVLCTGSSKDLPRQGPFFAKHFNTVDSFDTHAKIPKYFADMKRAALNYKHIAIICAGWDPGTFSLERVLADAFIPESKKFTFWGPGVSQGHSDAIRRVEGVADAIQYTMPIKDSLNLVREGKNPDLTTGQKHWRDCYVALKEGADPEKVREEIESMPNYFLDYVVRVTFETPEQIAERKKEMPHGGFVLTIGETGQGNKALIEYRNDWKSNPDATGSILVACARANYRLQGDIGGAFTMLDIPPAYLSPHSRDELLKDFM